MTKLRYLLILKFRHDFRKRMVPYKIKCILPYSWQNIIKKHRT